MWAMLLSSDSARHHQDCLRFYSFFRPIPPPKLRQERLPRRLSSSKIAPSLPPFIFKAWLAILRRVASFAFWNQVAHFVRGPTFSCSRQSP